MFYFAFETLCYSPYGSLGYLDVLTAYTTGEGVNRIGVHVWSLGVDEILRPHQHRRIETTCVPTSPGNCK
jgi:hypothetical protein